MSSSTKPIPSLGESNTDLGLWGLKVLFQDTFPRLMVGYIEFFTLGLLQGILEWLPISSQGSLVLLLVLLLGFKPSEAADISILLHIGTCLAALIYFRNDIARILRRSSEEDERMLLFLIIASSATALSGLPAYLLFRETATHGEAFLGMIGGALIITGLAQIKGRYRGRIAAGAPSTSTALLIGLIQGLSAIPGLSRSGITISTLLFYGYQGGEALRISYLLSIPASLLATFGLMLINRGLLEPHMQMAVIASFISGLITIGTLMRISKKINFSYFCIFIGSIALISFLLRFMII
jgi:undecaprenyl-diphosphatase